jgi:basic amino acid/polyamine antiporter, APA family
LKRLLGLQMVVVIVLGNILGSGVYKKVAPMAAELESPGWVLLCWLLGGIITLFGALCNAEVAGLLADTGGEYQYYKRIYNRFFAFIFGWSLFTVIQTAAISSLAYVFAQSFANIVALPDSANELAAWNIGGVFYPFADLPIKLTAIGLIVLLTWINTKGIKTGAGLSKALMVLIVTGILAIIIFGWAHGTVPASAFGDFNTNKTVGFSSVFTAMLAAFWAYQGWAGIGYIGGEVKDARRNIPRGIVMGVLLAIVLYLLINAAYLSVLSIADLQAIHAAGNRIAAVEAVRGFWGTQGAMIISILILITTLGCTHVNVLASSRPYYAMAREGMFFPAIGKLNTAQVPGRSLVLQGVWACLLVFSGTFDQLTDMIIFAVFIYYGATTLGVFILRRKMPDAPRPYKVWGYPVVPAIVILFCLALFGNTIVARPREAMIGMGLMLTGVPLYFYFRKKYVQTNQHDTKDI